MLIKRKVGDNIFYTKDSIRAYYEGYIDGLLQTETDTYSIIRNNDKFGFYDFYYKDKLTNKTYLIETKIRYKFFNDILLQKKKVDSAKEYYEANKIDGFIVIYLFMLKYKKDNLDIKEGGYLIVNLTDYLSGEKDYSKVEMKETESTINGKVVSEVIIFDYTKFKYKFCDIYTCNITNDIGSVL
jgi:hypothetical protein